MEITVEELNSDTTCLRMNGRLDMTGSGEIDLRFTALTTTDSTSIVVDMGGVDFIASIGMRLLLICAKAKKSRGGKMVLVNLQPMVMEALETAGIDTLISILPDVSAALITLQD
jgi:anti-anti-sigma factor